jgi:hypothetical protein
MEDLNDLVAARQWFIRLAAKDWEAAVNHHIGQTAMSTVSTDANLLQTMMQVSLWHYYKARDHYYENRNAKMVERIQFDIERATQLLTSYAQGASHIEAAKIAAISTVRHGEHVRKGLESLGHSVQYGLTALGEHIENFGGSLSHAMKASSTSLSANITGAMYTLAGTSKMKGRSLDRRMSEIGQLISTTSREVPDGFFAPVRELGAKFALGAVGHASSTDITSDPSVIRLAESVEPEIRMSEESMKRLDEPSIKLTGTLFDMLITKGMSKVVEELESAKSADPKV